MRRVAGEGAHAGEGFIDPDESFTDVVASQREKFLRAKSELNEHADDEVIATE